MEEIEYRLGSSPNEVQAEEKRGLAEGYIHIHGPLATALHKWVEIQLGCFRVLCTLLKIEEKKFAKKNSLQNHTHHSI